MNLWWSLFCTPALSQAKKSVKMCNKETSNISLYPWKTSSHGYKHVMTLFWVLVSVSSGSAASWSSFPVLNGRTRHPGPCYLSDGDTWCDLCGVHRVRRGIHTGAGSGLADVTLTENREQRRPCWCQREARFSKPAPPSHWLDFYLSFNGLGIFLQQSGWYIWVINTHAPSDRISVIMCCVD